MALRDRCKLSANRLFTPSRSGAGMMVTIVFAVALISLGAAGFAQEQKAADSQAAVEKLVQALEQVQSDPKALEALQQTLQKELEELRAASEAAKNGGEQAKQADELKAKIEELTKQFESTQAELKKLEAEIPELQKQLEAIRPEQEKSAQRLSAIEGALKFLEGLQPKTDAAAAKPESKIQPVASNLEPVNFNRDIRPILSNNCYQCHGPDEATRKAKLRLDDGEGLFAALKSGNVPVVPGDREKSELWKRITTEASADKMPPAASGKMLNERQIALMGRWIDEGAKWERHWAFVPPEQPPLPEVKNTGWAKNEIDRFILARLEQEKLAPSPEADKHSLIRRVTLDLTGLPPTPKDVEDFLKDESPDAYEKVVDRLLASERYGEHMARYWLDAARYADTNGYHIDNERFMWRWRDWVIGAFNGNMPYDQFTVEQLAGDLLPDATLSQKIASGFNRNHMINFEGGAIPEEYRVAYVNDRVETTGTVWMGMTLACASCHDHKFDPVSQKEFYQIFAFFNNVPEEGLDGRQGNAPPRIPAPLPEQETKLAEYKKQIADLNAEMDKPMPLVDAVQAKWETEWAEALRGRWSAIGEAEYTAAGGATFKKLDDGSVLVEGENPDTDTYEITAKLDGGGYMAIRLEALTHESLGSKSLGRAGSGNFVLTEFEAEAAPASNPEALTKVNFRMANADYSQKDFDIARAIDGDAKTGWAVDGSKKKENRNAVFIASEPFGIEQGTILKIRMKHESAFAKHNVGRFRLSVTADPAMAASRLGTWYVNGPFKAEDGNTAYETEYEPEKVVDTNATYEDGKYKWLPRADLLDGKNHDLIGDIAATYLYRTIDSPSDRKMTLSIGSNDAVKIWFNGEVVLDKNVQRSLKRDEDQITVNVKEGENALLVKVVNYGASYAFYFNKADEQVGAVPFEIEHILITEVSQRSEEQQRKLRDYYRKENSQEYQKLSADLAALEKEADEFEKQIPTAMIMAKMEKPRETFVLVRGQYDQNGDKVEPQTPEALPPMPEDLPRDRLGLAKWLVDPKHPLTARVAVNRFWQQYFGYGIVKTAEDFGSQGELPSHPELLDWLATDFIASGWDVKRLQRMIVTSAAYRQSAVVSPELQERDPDNRLVARGPRIRMDAEMIRDNALSIAGLLVEHVGGPSVKPYQPQGLWEEVAYGAEYSAQRYEQDKGDKLYRRSMYTFWKRQAPPPTMLLFDAPNRETCTVRRSRTNTPLQALALLNSTQFVEAARTLAERMMTEGGAEPADRVRFAFRLATARMPSDREMEVLLRVYEEQLNEFKANGEAAVEFVSVGESKPNEELNKSELAAWTAVASTIMNLDETITKG